MLLHMEVTPDINLDSMKYKGSCILGSAYIRPLVRVCTEKLIFLLVGTQKNRFKRRVF